MYPDSPEKRKIWKLIFGWHGVVLDDPEFAKVREEETDLDGKSTGYFMPLADFDDLESNYQSDTRYLGIVVSSNNDIAGMLETVDFLDADALDALALRAAEHWEDTMAPRLKNAQFACDVKPTLFLVSDY